MSQENVAVGRRMIEDFNERTSWWDALDENIEWHARGDEPDAGVHHGRQGVRRYIGGWEDMFPGYQIEVTGPIVDLGDQVILPAQLVGAARTTGIRVREPYVFLLTVSNGLITLTREFGREADALKAAELGEWAVSQENVEIVLDAYARYNAGERRPELWYWHEDAEYHVAKEDPDSEVRRGIDAIRKQTERWEEAYPDLKVEPLEAKDAGEQVFLWVRFVGHGAASGLPIDMELAHVLTLEDGRVRRCEEFMDRSEALKAVGLEE